MSTYREQAQELLSQLTQAQQVELLERLVGMALLDERLGNVAEMRRAHHLLIQVKSAIDTADIKKV